MLSIRYVLQTLEGSGNGIAETKRKFGGGGRTRTYDLRIMRTQGGVASFLKAFHFIRFFHRLQGWASCPLCIRFERF